MATTAQTIVLVFLLPWLTALWNTSALANERVRLVENWSAYSFGTRGVPGNWKTYGPDASFKYPPSIVIDDGRMALRLKTHRYSIRIGLRVVIDLDEMPVLSWEWKALILPQHGDARGEVNDQVARIFVLFESFAARKAIGYVWDTAAPIGTVTKAKTPFLDRRLVVVRSGGNDRGTWQSETRNVHEDYAGLFGAKPPTVVGVGIESHSEDGNHESEALIGTIMFKRRRSGGDA